MPRLLEWYARPGLVGTIPQTRIERDGAMVLREDDDGRLCGRSSPVPSARGSPSGRPSPFILGFRRDDQDADVGPWKSSEAVHSWTDRNELRGLVGKRRDECFGALLNQQPAASQV